MSPHQNAKVFGLLMALSSLILILPMMVIFSFMPAGIDSHGNAVTPPTFLLLFFPIVYFVVGYIMVVVGCIFYNFAYKFIGGFEYEAVDQKV
jgi:uncharacterized membrane protein